MSITSPVSHPADSPSPLVALDVARGVTRMLLRHELVAIPEVPLEGGRRADLMALDARGRITIVEIKVSRADLLGDAKWRDYLDHCDRFFWAVPAGFDVSPIETEAFLPERTGLIVADRYDAAVLREARSDPLSSHARKRCTLAFARRAARRLIAASDPEAGPAF
ncbi:MmcB family DNA repair protein [uncultured Sphingomonas sp.]|uniref:MmcB family DNA repair protein n=1 Tax=uncultured Sphingomonas sp. TaxID=158754 RepID=UPI00260F7E41|nr:MmcB family DNA repair protein [uncultured Sphingomonas sp.]